MLLRTLSKRNFRGVLFVLWSISFVKEEFKELFYTAVSSIINYRKMIKAIDNSSEKNEVIL